LPLDWRLPGIPEPVSWARDESAVEAEGGSAPVEFRWAREAIRHLGTVVHWALQHLGREGIDRWTKERVRLLRPALERRLREEGLPSERVEPMVSLAETALTRTLSDPRGRWLFDPRHRDAHVEYAISGFVDGTMVNAILDRTFVDDKGVRWIVDYKVSSHEGGGLDEFLDRERERYAPQLERYGALMSAMDVRPIRLGLYFPLLGGWREWERGRCPFLRGDGASE
jgi:ATP-dependent helicase/nuclease subunit A